MSLSDRALTPQGLRRHRSKCRDTSRLNVSPAGRQEGGAHEGRDDVA